MAESQVRGEGLVLLAACEISLVKVEEDWKSGFSVRGWQMKDAIKLHYGKCGGYGGFKELLLQLGSLIRTNIWSLLRVSLFIFSKKGSKHAKHPFNTDGLLPAKKTQVVFLALKLHKIPLFLACSSSGRG